MTSTPRISRRRALIGLLRGAVLLPLVASTAGSRRLPRSLGPPKPASYAKLPRWRGFNLLEKFTLDSNKAYKEWDLDFMAEWGFDFARLPTDYRIWTAAPGAYREQPLQEIDQAIGWARQRGIHVNLCLHRAPGYHVNSAGGAISLWADDSGGEEARRQFSDQWRMFAQRYRGIPADELSFNLVNEPPDIPVRQYLRAVGAAVEAIRAEDPERLIIADGLRWGLEPVSALIPMQIAQSTRGYMPVTLSHYRAHWIAESGVWPVPSWPTLAAINSYLYGHYKPELQTPLILTGDFAAGGTVGVRVQLVSSQARLLIKADGAAIFDRTLSAGPGEGEWKETTFRPEWGIYMATYDRVYRASFPSQTRELSLELLDGDWLSFTEIRIAPFSGAPDGELVLRPGDTTWGARQDTFVLDAQGTLAPVSGPPLHSKETLWRDYVEPWADFAAAGTGVHVGEWGAHAETPHEVVLAWMRDCLENWRRAGIGWALWNLRGTFGPVDSNRPDVAYEDYRGRKLDRAMLELLRQG